MIIYIKRLDSKTDDEDQMMIDLQNNIFVIRRFLMDSDGGVAWTLKIINALSQKRYTKGIDRLFYNYQMFGEDQKKGG